MAYSLPDLPYSNAALEPHIDARTMEIHHDKHHNAYVTKLIEMSSYHDSEEAAEAFLLEHGKLGRSYTIRAHYYTSCS